MQEKSRYLLSSWKDLGIYWNVLGKKVLSYDGQGHFPFQLHMAYIFNMKHNEKILRLRLWYA